MGNTWAAKNPEKWREYKRDWYLRNKDKQARYRQAWEARNPDYWEQNREHRSKRAAAYWIANRASMIPRSLLRAARRRSKERGIVCTITAADIVVPTRCPLLGVPLFLGDKKQGPNSPTLDRIDNDKGYVPGNVWVISHCANACKGALSADEIIQIGTRLQARVAASLAEGAAQMRSSHPLEHC